MTVALAPELASALSDYAAVYSQTYGADERPEALIPAMLETFLGLGRRVPARPQIPRFYCQQRRLTSWHKIGTFTQKDGTYTGTIRTMTINVKAQLVPNKRREKQGRPRLPPRRRRRRTRRGLASGFERRRNAIPRDQTRRSELRRPMRAAFFENEKEGTGVMVWNRQRQADLRALVAMATNQARTLHRRQGFPI